MQQLSHKVMFSGQMFSKWAIIKYWKCQIATTFTTLKGVAQVWYLYSLLPPIEINYSEL